MVPKPGFSAKCSSSLPDFIVAREGLGDGMGERRNSEFRVCFVQDKKIVRTVIPPRRRCAPPQRGMKTGASGANMSAAGGT